ncbi:MAG: helix-turn-helix transcriptional regulator [Deltaproteobacteria bacterium]|nr:helix-turn-helix transcriptional regulator [Deltaproteobacteria bacterium]
MTKQLLSTKEVAQFLSVNEKMVYSLVSEKRLPATKITGKWLFPKHLVEQWIEANTINYPEPTTQLPPYDGLLIIAGSNDPLLDATLSLFNRLHPNHIAVFGNVGSMGGFRALRRNRCHIATSHLMQEAGDDYNFEYAAKELEQIPAVVNFCMREQGLIVQKGNPKGIQSISDLAKSGVVMVNRPIGTGTRLLLDTELANAGISNKDLDGYHTERSRHLDVGLDILAGRADAAMGIRPIATALDLAFIPIRWERYDLMAAKDRFFDPGAQLFMGLLHEKAFLDQAEKFEGYDLSLSGKMVYPKESS